MANEQQPLIVCRMKTFFYNFMPSKAEEEACKINNKPWVPSRELIEVGPDLYNTVRIMRKKIAHLELSVGKLWFPFSAVFKYILPYWDLEMARSLMNGTVLPVNLWDDTEKNRPMKYGDGSITFSKLSNDDYCLSCKKLIKDRGLAVDDEIKLYWDPKHSMFVFKFFPKVGDSANTPILVD